MGYLSNSSPATTYVRGGWQFLEGICYRYPGIFPRVREKGIPPVPPKQSGREAQENIWIGWGELAG